jgi:hypothetical protein
MASKIPNPLLEAINAALKAAGQKTVQTTSKSVAKTAKKAASRPSVTAKKAAKRAVADIPPAPKGLSRMQQVERMERLMAEEWKRADDLLKMEGITRKPAKKAAKRAAAPKAAAPKRSEKQIENIMKHNPQFSREQAAQVAGMSREQRRELNAALHRAKTEAAAAEKKAGREATQAKNRIAHREKNEAKMNSYQKWKAEQAAKSAEPVVPKQKRSRKKGAK